VSPSNTALAASILQRMRLIFFHAAYEDELLSARLEW